MNIWDLIKERRIIVEQIRLYEEKLVRVPDQLLRQWTDNYKRIRDFYDWMSV